MKPSSPVSHDNGFGVMRLAFAILVLVSHAPELADGNRNREILTRIFGGLSFGEFAVDGFFVISGALITASWLNATSWRDYLWRRVVRIYPGFVVAFAVCLLVVAPLGGGTWPGWVVLATACIRALMLGSPDIGPVFDGTPFPLLNGAVWTIPHEFGCYLMIGGLGLLGLLRRRRLVLALALAACLLGIRHYYMGPAMATGHPLEAGPDAPHLGPLGQLLDLQYLKPSRRLISLFLMGCSYHLWSDVIAWRWTWALAALAGLIVGLGLPSDIAEIGFAVFGAYLIFYLAQAAKGTVWARINARNDISYGIYLYGWPLQKLVWWYVPGAPLALAFALTLILAVGFGWASWLWVERPALRWARRSAGRSAGKS